MQFLLVEGIMFNKNKKKFYLGLFLFFFFWICSIWYVNATTFSERLSEVGLDMVSFSNKSSISRYEVARLLNAANCQDCIQAPIWMRQTYTQNFWDKFKQIDWKDFNDIGYEAGVWNKKSYYYCVAYVGDNGYMEWYPSTSTKCKWSFCGQESITISEFYQTVLNIIQDQIRGKYLIDWSKVKSRKKWLKKNSMQMKVLNQTDLNIIDKAESKVAYAQTNNEFQTWLKYCMYNLSDCNFQSFGVIWTWYWPVSELNILYKEWIISLGDAQKVASFSNMPWDEAIRILSAVYDNYANCSFNVDYDCDGITNWKDNCPYVYNLNQYDLDGDWIGNVCDDDIDWDGKKNLVWVVDDNNHIIVSLWKKDLDQTILGNGDMWFSFFINVDSIGAWYPTLVKFEPLTNWNIVKIEWDFWDGNKKVVNNWNKITHTYRKSGTFTVKAEAISKNWSKSFAMNKLFIAIPESENYALNIQSNLTFKNWSVDYVFTPLYSWDFDRILWSINNQNEKSQKLTEWFKVTVKEKGRYVVTAKWYKGWDLKAVAMLTILQDWSPRFSNMIVTPKSLWEETLVSSNLVWLRNEDIDHVNINRWWFTQSSNNIFQKYEYDEPWLKTIQYDVVLKDGRVLYNVATISVQNPLLKQSYATNIVWDRLGYNQNEKLALWLSMYPTTPIISLFTSYQAGHKNFLYAPNLSNTVLNFSYPNAWDKLLTNSVEVNKCVALVNQWTVHINSVDVCENAIKNGTLSNYKCDLDWDKIPDICDDDIDWDGVKNLIWIILYENKDCSIWENNINLDLLKKHQWVCSLDNCFFVSNVSQSDLNNNWIWDQCENDISKLLSSSLLNVNITWSTTVSLDKDQDWDGVPDSVDACLDIPGNSNNGCPEYYTQNCWIKSDCGNGKLDEWETCHNCPQDAWVCCWNWVLDYWESCKTCPTDAGNCKTCGNWKIDEWENCKNCPEDVWECSAWCGNGKIEDAENCRNCPEDVKECEWICGDGKIQESEDCKNCSEDAKVCKTKTCGDGKIDKESWEECDDGKNNGKDGQCTLKCIKYDPEKPKCGNWEIEEGENCESCPVDLWEKCVKNGDENPPKTCRNGKIDNWEDCKNCPEDVWECSAWCGNGKIEDAENCRNCPEDVKECEWICGDGKIQESEDCKNCSEDAKVCKTKTCGDGKIDKESWEECDDGKNNGKDEKCTLKCTKYNPDKPKCGNWEIEDGENCETCSVDLWEKCVKDGDENPPKICGNGKIDNWEQCDPKDVNKTNWWEYWCSNLCKMIWSNEVICNPDFDWEILLDLQNSDNLCFKWVSSKFIFNSARFRWTWLCISGSQSIECVADRTTCGDWIFGRWENCETCSVDVKDPCIDDGENECGNGKIDEWENCENCPKDVKDICIDDGENECGNGKIDEWENCENCPEDMNNCDMPIVPYDSWWAIEIDNCNICPCDYTDVATDLTKWDVIRARLWDKTKSVFYRYSPAVSLEKFLDVR